MYNNAMVDSSGNGDFVKPKERSSEFANEHFYHLFNHGVEDCLITRSQDDSDHFVLLLELLNTSLNIGSVSDVLKTIEPGDVNLLKSGLLRLAKNDETRLVKIVAYCLNPNHFHLILEQIRDGGITIFLHKLTMAYSKYINARHTRKGALFFGTFGRRLIETDEYLLHASAYVNLNDRVHRIAPPLSNLVRTSWREYTEEGLGGICEKELVMENFDDMDDYKAYALSALAIMLEHKMDEQELKQIGIDL